MTIFESLNKKMKLFYKINGFIKNNKDNFKLI